MELLITVMAHAEAKPAILRHLPYWTALSENILFLCPSDSIPDVPGYHFMAVGKKSHHGDDAVNRLRYLFITLLGLGAKKHVVFEYDALCFGDLPSWPPGSLAGNVFQENHPNPAFRAKNFVHPPLCFTAEVLGMLCEAMRGVTNYAEAGYWDRWLGLVCSEGNIPLHDFMRNGEGFSHNTIHPVQYESARQARLSGAKMFHGIKNKETLEAILK